MPQPSLRQRDGKIANNWYIACLGHELKSSPIQRIIYDQPYVLFRDEKGVARAMPDRCLHRHSLLSMGGTVKNGHLVCSYHGWKYNGSGEVVEVPSEGPQFENEGKKYCQPKVPCMEQDSAVWIWTGEPGLAPPAPSWRFPNFGKQGWIHYFMITDFKNEVTNLAENFMDVPHTVYVHKGWFRDKKNQKTPMTVETKDGTVLVTYHQQQDKLSFVAQTVLNPTGKPMVHTDKFIFPNITRVDYWFGNNGFIINSQITPVGELNSRVYTYIAYRMPFFGRLFELVIRFYTRQVIEQDVRIMQNQGTSLEFNPECAYRSTPADEVHIGIERLRQYGKVGDEKLISFCAKKEIEFWT